MTYETLLVAPFKEMITGFVDFLPALLSLFMSLVILAVGWLIAKVMAKMVVQVLRTITFDNISDKIGLTDILKKGGVKDKPSSIVGCVTYWIMMIMVLMTTVESLGYTIADDFLTTLFMYIPQVVLGAVTLMIGMLLAKVVSTIIYITAKVTDMPIPETLKTLTTYAIVIYVSIIYLQKIGFLDLFGGVHFTYLMMGIVFAVSLSFGLAGKDLATKYLGVLKK